MSILPRPTPASLRIGDRRITLHEGETVLEGLERAGMDVASGCRSGTCCKCMQRADDPPEESQRGLRLTLKADGYFLACIARPVGTLRLADPKPRPVVCARVERSEAVSVDVRRILLRPESSFPFRAGQYLEVIHPSGAARNYSIASLPADGVLELHVRRLPEGLVSGWLHGLSEDDSIEVRGAFGQCFYVLDDPDQKLLLVGAGTGLAPLLGILRDALAHGHTGPIDLVHGALTPDRLYMRDELVRIAAVSPNVRVHSCVLRAATSDEHEGSLDEVAIRLAGPLDRSRAFLCGDAGIVRHLQRGLFLAGVASSEILADPFDAQ